MKTKLLLLVSLILLCLNLKSQTNPCGTDVIWELAKKKDSLFQQKFQEEEAKYKKWSKGNQSRSQFAESRNEARDKQKEIAKIGISPTSTGSPCPYTSTIYGPYAAPTAINSILSISNMFGGQGVRISGLVAGNTYQIYTCGQNDYNTELTIYGAGGGLVWAFNSGACINNQSSITFTPISSGDFDVLINQAPNCGSTYIYSTVIYVNLTHIQGTCAYSNAGHYLSAAPSALNQTITFPQTMGGYYNRVTGMVAGNIYRIYTCGNTAFDTQLSIFTAGGGQAVAYNDDACGLQSEIYFTALTSGDYDIVLNAFPCGSNSINMDVNVTLAYTPRPLITIPVVVHVLYNNSVENISIAQIQSQIAVLNRDFNLQHSGLSSVPPQFRGECANPLIQFCLAQQDPNGNATSGITRTYTPNVDFTLPDTNVFHSSHGGEDAWNKNNYLNIWVCNVANNTPSGIAFPNHPLIGSAFGTYYMGIGVVLWHKSFGTSGTVTPYFQYGKNAVHEIGHWLGLWHLWNHTTINTCSSDSISDTPPQYQATQPGNYSYGFNSVGYPLNQSMLDFCTNGFPGLMYYNYMDYPIDDVRNMFTYWQADRTDYGLFNWYSSLQTSQGCVAPVATGLKVQDFGKNISIYPNPNMGKFSVIQNDDVCILNISISNIVGEVVFETITSGGKTDVDLSIQANGLYFVRCQSVNGSVTKKILINK